MSNANTQTMRQVIKAALFTPTNKGWGLPLLFWGSPGVAKSDIITEVCDEYDMFCLCLSPGERGEGAFGVTPVPLEIKSKTGSMTVMSYPMPEWVLDIEKHDGRACVFLDELNTASGPVKPALLGMIQARRIGGAYLGQGVRVLGAANPPEDSAEGSELPAATANRLGHIDWIAPGLQDWGAWLLSCDALSSPTSAKGDAEDEEQRVLSLWPAAFAAARASVLGYLNGKLHMLHAKPDASDPALGRAWPSRRSWYFASLAMASASVHGLAVAEKHSLVKGFVGEAAMKELVQWEIDNALPNALDVLDGKIKFKHDPIRLDISRAVLNSCAAVVSDPKTEKRLDRGRAYFKLLHYIVIDEGLTDLGVIGARVVAKSQPVGSKRLTDLDEAKRVLKELRPTMAVAGYGV